MIVNQSNDGEPLSYPGVKDALVTAQPENYCPQTRSQVTAHPEHDLSADSRICLRRLLVPKLAGWATSSEWFTPCARVGMVCGV
jgi:hypothetical protein